MERRRLWGRRSGASASLDPTDAGCSKTGLALGIREAGSIDLPGTGLSADESSSLDTNGVASIEGGIDTPIDGLTGTLTSEGGSLKGNIAPVLGGGFTKGGSEHIRWSRRFGPDVG